MCHTLIVHLRKLRLGGTQDHISCMQWDLESNTGGLTPIRGDKRGDTAPSLSSFLESSQSTLYHVGPDSDLSRQGFPFLFLFCRFCALNVLVSTKSQHIVMKG